MTDSTPTPARSGLDFRIDATAARIEAAAAKLKNHGKEIERLERLVADHLAVCPGALAETAS